jgi:hypothetical protein
MLFTAVDIRSVWTQFPKRRTVFRDPDRNGNCNRDCDIGIASPARSDLQLHRLLREHGSARSLDLLYEALPLRDALQ